MSKAAPGETLPARAAGSLAGEFACVDQTADPGRFVACLAFLDAIPFFRDYKTDSRQALGLGPGDAVLEVGCGLGRDLAALSAVVGPGGLAVGLDASLTMLARAREETASGGGAGTQPTFLAGDALSLPFADGAFAACRADRTLQHLSDPFRAIAELARVVRPGGRVSAVEPDWGGYMLDAAQRDAARTVEALWRDRFPSGLVGRTLVRGMAACGLTDIAVEARVFVSREFAEADAVYDISRTVAEAADAGRMSREQGRAFLAELRAADAGGRFVSSLTFFSVMGRKPVA
jgi:SAM-dependent methyltransferase